MVLQDLKSYQILTKLNSSFKSQIDEVFNTVRETINGIAGCYNNYTMHDMEHGLRVASYMEQIALGISNNEEEIKKYNELELTLLILSAILHDIGMFIRPNDKKEIKSNNIKYKNGLTYKGVLKVMGNEDDAIKEIVRLTHAARIKDFIDYDYGNGNKISSILKLNNNSGYADDIVQICMAHGEDYNFLKDLRTETTKGVYTYNTQYLAVLLRIADYLDLDSKRTPMMWFSMMDIKGYSKEEWERHFIIHNDTKLKEYMDGKMQIYFDGESSDAKIHRKYLKYIDDLKKELENADELLNIKTAKSQYKFNVSTKIDNCVRTKGFQYSDLRLNLNYSAITELLMGKNIYGDCRLGLREIMQNAIDACKIMKEIPIDNNYLTNLAIKILYSKKENYVKIKDTGIGMTLDIVKNNFLNIGQSYYKSNEYLYNNYKYEPIGQYGIGFLSCFLLSDNVTVKTKHFSKNEVYQIELEKQSEYVVTKEEKTPIFWGTEITLDYNKFMEVFMSVRELKNFLETYFFTEIPIILKNVDDGIEETISNSGEKDINKFVENFKKDSKPEIIECQKFSDKFNGKLLLWQNKRIAKKYFIELSDYQLYLYNKNDNVFEKVDNVQNGYYYCFNYSTIDKEDYDRIINANKNANEILKDLIAYSKNKNKEAILLFNNKPAPFIDEFKNNRRLIKALKNSGLSYYSLFFDYRNYRQIFSADMKAIEVYDCRFEEMFGIRFSQYLDKISRVYYKDILVNNFHGLYFVLPDEYNIMGYINYKGNDLKLDVSRNTIIQGKNILNNEINKIILQYKYEKEEIAVKKNILKAMLEYKDIHIS